MKTRQFSGLMVWAIPVLVFLANVGIVAPTELGVRPPVVQAELEKPFDLKIGQSAQVDSMSITFARVVQDSRCPSDVVCVWAGDAAVELMVAYPETERTPITLHTSLTPKEVTVDEYLVRLISVAPYPKSTVQIEPRDYKIELEILKDPAPVTSNSDD